MKQSFNQLPPPGKKVPKILIAIHIFLHGVVAGAVGLIAATVLGIVSISEIHPWLILSLAIVIMIQPNTKWRIAAIILCAGVYSLIFLR